MKVFNGKQAAEDYMSSHTLAFSTPELTLMRFSFWLGDMVPDPTNKEKSMPRLMTFVEEKDFEPVQIIDDEKYEPSGAVRVSGMYGNTAPQTSSNTKFCSECGGNIAVDAKFCTECGTTQV
jgi:ribosomal protein L40E